MLWHQWFSHPSAVILQKFFHTCNILHNSNKTLDVCNACCCAKNHKIHFSLSTSWASYPLELIHADLWGPTHVPFSTVARYLLLLMDDYFRFVWLYLLPTKDQVHSTFVQFKTLVENQFQTTIKCLLTDHGGEFTTLTQFLSLHGIFHRFSCPYTPKQNGQVKRKIRHVVDIGLTLLYTDALPSKFWSYAFTTTVTFINSMLSPLLNYSSPFSLLYKHPPNYFDFKVFGCLVIHTSNISTSTNFSHGPHPISFLVMQHLTRVIFVSILQLTECISLGM